MCEYVTVAVAFTVATATLEIATALKSHSVPLRRVSTVTVLSPPTNVEAEIVPAAEGKKSFVAATSRTPATELSCDAIAGNGAVAKFVLSVDGRHRILAA